MGTITEADLALFFEIEELMAAGMVKLVAEVIVTEIQNDAFKKTPINFDQN